MNLKDEDIWKDLQDDKTDVVDGGWLKGAMTKQDMVDQGWNLDIEFPDDGEEDFLTGKTCNPDAPEECESCQ